MTSDFENSITMQQFKGNLAHKIVSNMEMTSDELITKYQSKDNLSHKIVSNLATTLDDLLIYKELLDICALRRPNIFYICFEEKEEIEMTVFKF